MQDALTQAKQIQRLAIGVDYIHKQSIVTIHSHSLGHSMEVGTRRVERTDAAQLWSSA